MAANLTARERSLWRPLSDEPDHPIARWDGAPVGGDLSLEAWLGPRNSVGASYFRLHLASDDLGRSQQPVVFGMQNSGPFPGFNWVEVVEYREQLAMDDGGTVAVPAGIERQIFMRLAELVPAGGHLMAEYDSRARRMTARALTAGVPPRATPLGATLAAVGCGVAFRDWYISEGGREGPRKLQGFRAVDDEHEQRRDEETLAALDAFMAATGHLDWTDWDLQMRTRGLAQHAIDELKSRLTRGPTPHPA